jgi:septal ring factor EnvC (AmiA/AmiB activator)
VKRRLLWPMVAAALLLSSLPPLAAAQSDEEKARSQLRELQQDIKRINREIASASARKNNLQQQLRNTEVELGKLQAAISGTRTEMALQRDKLQKLEAQRIELQQASQQQRDRVAIEMENAWKAGRQDQLRVLLSQDSPDTVARNLHYYRYFFEARSALLAQYRDTLAELASLETQIGNSVDKLAEQQQKLEGQQAKLGKAQRNRQLAMANLSKDISSKDRQLKQLELDRKELEELLQAIEEAVVNLQVPENYQSFSSAKGNMPWPLQGKPSNRYGRARNDGKMRWQGLTIPAKEGATVRAIHHGRVVYADWFRGSGLLLIIDHGEGYMSLYAHNQSLMREVGEWVSAGDPVSTAGNSGGQERSALYFEIRHNGKPTNPGQWCRG